MHSKVDRRALLRSFLTLAFAAIALFAPLSGCNRSKAPSSERQDKLVIFAAASLRDAFTTMANAFEKSHPGVAITFNFAGTQELRTQVEHGAAVDVLASADQRHMEALVRDSHAANPVVFARNEPVVVVSQESAAAVRSFAELPNVARILVGTPEVPIGRYTVQILDRAEAALGPGFRKRFESKVVSRELNVRQVLAKVSLGEAQAGIVYRTDALTARARVSVVTIPPELNVLADYPIAVMTGAAQPQLARQWVEFVLSAEGQRALASAGFLPRVIEAKR